MRRVGRAALLRPVLLAVLPAVLLAAAGCGSHAHHRSSTSHPHPSIHRYVAMGDSYTAGTGIPTINPHNGCQRSDHNYPTLLAARLGATLVDVSCGGAMIEDVTRVQPGITPATKPMIDAVTPDTDLVTISLGLNDAFLYDPLVECPQLTAQSSSATPCTDWEKAQGDTDLLGRMPAMEQKLVAVLTLLKQHAPHARVLMVGVPQLIPAHGSCAAYPIHAGDYPYFREAFVQLATAMRQAAETAGATYVDMVGPSAGHDVCAGQDAWINGAIPATDATYYHPFAVEQAVVADQIQKALGEK